MGLLCCPYLAFSETAGCESGGKPYPSYYADKLCISPVYLNETVKATTGLSVSRMIQYEIVLRAKRMLAYTDCSVKEIALELGFDDCSYFIKIFTKQTGISPVQFRKNHKYSNTDHE